jgi:PAS domain S-box-containing protein
MMKKGNENAIPFKHSIRLRILALILGLTFLSVIIISYVSISSIQRVGQNAQTIGNAMLQNQAEELLVELTVDDALKNEHAIEDIRLDADHLAQFIGNIYADPDAYSSQSYWRTTDHMFIAEDGQYINGEEDIATIFAPNFVEIDGEFNTNINLSAYLDNVAPAILESDDSTVAIYLIHQDEFTRLYPNINLGAILPPEYKATDDIFYTIGTPDSNPTQGVVWTPVYDDPAGQGLLISAIAPIYINEDEFIGVIGIDLSLTELTNRIETASPVTGGYSFLINEDGLALALPKQGYEDILGEPLGSGTSGAGTDLSDVSTNFAAAIESMVSGETGFQTIESNGRDLFIAYAPLPDVGWSLATVVEAENMLQVVAALQEEIAASMQSLVLFRIIPISLALMVAAMIIGLFLTNRIVAPVIKLSTIAGQVGAGNWEQAEMLTPETERGDELGVLAAAFQNMASRLKTLVSNLESRVASRTQDLNLAAEIGRDISQIRDIGELLSNSVERIRSRFDLYYAQIYLTNEYSDSLTLAAGTGDIGKNLLTKGHHLAIDTRSINGLAATEKRPVIVEDTAQSPLFQPNPALPYTRSEMAIPLIVGERVLGVIDLQSRERQGLNEDNLPAFEALAGQLAVSIENTSLFKEQERLTHDLRENARQLVENSTFLGSVIDNIPLMIFVKDAKEFRMLRWNKKSTEYFGLTEADVIGKTDYDYFPREEAEIYLAQDRKALAEGGLIEFPEEIQQTVYGERIMRVMKIPIFDPNGDPQYILGIIQDITEQKEAEYMLNERMKELSLLNAIRRKSDEQPSVADFLEFVANRIPAGMQFPDLCKVAITLDDVVYGSPEAIDLPTQIVEGLRIDGELVGRIYIAYTEKQIFLNEESALIGNLGRRLNDYIVNQRLLERIQSTVSGLQTVAEVGTAVAMTLDTQQLLQEVVDLAKAKFGFYHAHIYQYNAVNDTLVLTAAAGEIGQKMVAERRHIPLTAPRSLVARAAREQKGLVVENVHDDPGFLPHPLLPDTQSELAVPLVAGTELIGVMDIQSDKLNGFTEEDVNIQTTLAAQIAVALQNARQYEQTQEALDEVNALQRALTREGWQAYMTAVNRTVQGFQTAQNKIQPIHTEEAPPNGDNEESITYPLTVRGTAIGQLGVNAANKNLSDEDLGLLESISEQVAEALERARLFEETETARSQTEALFSGSQQVVRATDTNEILRALVHATALRERDSVSLFLFDQPWQTEQPEAMIISATWRRDNEPSQVPAGTPYPLTTSPLTQLLDRDKPITFADITTDLRIDDKLRAIFLEQYKMKSFIVIPLLVGDQWLGFVLGTSYEPYYTSESDIRQIVSLAGQAATVVQSQRLYQAAQSRAQREQILREVSTRVASAVDAESVLQTATREIGRALGLDTFVYLKDPKKNRNY